MNRIPKIVPIPFSVIPYHPLGGYGYGISGIIIVLKEKRPIYWDFGLSGSFLSVCFLATLVSSLSSWVFLLLVAFLYILLSSDNIARRGLWPQTFSLPLPGWAAPPRSPRCILPLLLAAPRRGASPAPPAPAAPTTTVG